MSAAAIPERLGARRGAGRSLAWWGIVLAILTEATLFGILLFVYYYLYTLADQWPLGGIDPPELVRSSIRTGLLFASSATMSIADHALRRGRRGLAKLFLVFTFLLGAVFLIGHIEEMVTLPRQFTWATNAYGSLYYVIVNFHGAHLVVGLLMLVFAYAALARRRYSADSHEGFKVVGMYWHFVDVVWAFVFSTLFLVPNFLPK